MGEVGAGAGKAGPLGAPGPGRSWVPHSHDETAISLAWRRPPGGFRDNGNQDHPVVWCARAVQKPASQLTHSTTFL